VFVSTDCETLGAVRVNSQTVKELRGGRADTLLGFCTDRQTDETQVCQ